MKKSRLYLPLVLALLPGVAAAQVSLPVPDQQPAQAPPPPQPVEARKLVPALGWDVARQGGFVTAVVVDSQNNVWAGTGGNGLWRYDARKKTWTQFTTKDGLGDDDIQALAVDKLGRVWAGHLNHGVSVWNGEKWKNYGIEDGPLGSRVFAIATCPKDGDVWIATDCGAARYSLAKDDWDYYTRGSGLPSNQLQAVAFNADGDIFIGTQCDGVAAAKAAEGYKKWKTTAGPLEMPNAPVGDGLPTSLINDIALVKADDDTMVMAATPLGMSVSSDDAEDAGDDAPVSPDAGPAPDEWSFARGNDWKENVKGLYAVPPAPGDGDAEDVDDPDEPLLTEDWTTCIRQDSRTKKVWIGHRTKGVEIRDGDSGDLLATAGADAEACMVRAICLPPQGPPLIAVEEANGGGLMMLDDSKEELAPGGEAPKSAPPLPGAPKATDAASLAALAKQVDVFKNPMKPGEAAYLGDDWRTEGDWTGRYGGAYAMLCGLGEGGLFPSEQGCEVSVTIGPHNKEGASDAAQPHVASATTDDLRSLYNPRAGHRAGAELSDGGAWDDKESNKYPRQWEGPDLWVYVKVPAGLHRVSLYFTNNDGQTGVYNRFLDYDVQLLPWAEKKETVQKSEPLARARVTDFRGGVYKQFAVAGPAQYVVRVGRNHSIVTKLQGVFVDRLAPMQIKAGATPPEAKGLWDALDNSLDKPGATGLQIPLRVIAWRAALSGQSPDQLLAAWRSWLGIWTPEDRAGFDKSMEDIFKTDSAKPPQPPAQKQNPE